MKKYVIIISERFPKTHSKAGEETGFNSKIKQGLKIHTIRMNYELWAKRIKEVQEGNACLSIRKWSGLPYRSKQIELFNFQNLDGVGIERLQIGILGIFLNDDYITPKPNHNIIENIAFNDGLDSDDFREWFRKVSIEDELAIIHFTDFRYTS